ncbi:MAG: hypothetical protein Terrestrivirus4_102 [Terrestrivirus sp.]|uniref:Uncharacterized protein n=1 Tax=Terrestrivirus sp. TaxID=2487775 RepID=A0A3G4ZNT1_9VIRU|nr:MAG: hypothetical protein Terrestrivirus4_102 [Terrestrivirus sp.]
MNNNLGNKSSPSSYYQPNVNNYGNYNNHNKPNQNLNVNSQGNYGNNMLRGYQNYKMNNIPAQRNSLLNNNPNLNRLNEAMERERIARIQQQMSKMKQLQQIKQYEKYGELDRYMDKDSFRNAIIEPIKVQKNNNPQELITAYENKNMTEYGKNNAFLLNYWNTRTNEPYKSALKDVMDDPEYYKKNVGRDAKKLIIHKTTDADKIGLMDQYHEFQDVLEKHDTDLKVIYSTSKEGEYKKKFKWCNKSKFRIQYDPADFKKLKKGKMEYYQNQQMELERDKKRIEDLIDSAINDGVFNDEDIKNLSNEVSNDTNVKDLQEQLEKDLGEDARDLIREAISKVDNKNKKTIQKVNYIYDDNDNISDVSDDSDDDDNKNKSVKKIKKNKSSIKIDDNDEKDNKPELINTNTSINDIDKFKYYSRNKTEVNGVNDRILNPSAKTETKTEIKIEFNQEIDKYRMRQKKTIVN